MKLLGFCLGNRRYPIGSNSVCVSLIQSRFNVRRWSAPAFRADRKHEWASLPDPAPHLVSTCTLDSIPEGPDDETAALRKARRDASTRSGAVLAGELTRPETTLNARRREPAVPENLNSVRQLQLKIETARAALKDHQDEHNRLFPEDDLED